MIELEGVRKTYVEGTKETPVLKDVSLRIDAGEYLAIMGRSGTGKSTLMNVLGLLDKPDSGSYRLEGQEVSRLDDEALSRLRNRSIGFVFQQFNLLDRTTALRNVLLPFIYSEHYPAEAEGRARRALEAVGLHDRVTYRPAQLSGGQQQRVAIARALVNDPAIILADEPTGNLDRKSGLEILALFKGLHHSGRTIVLITHDEVVAQHAHRVVTLEDGRITSDTAVTRVLDPEAELREHQNLEAAATS